MSADEEGTHERPKMPPEQIFAVSRRYLFILTLPLRDQGEAIAGAEVVAAQQIGRGGRR